MEYSKNPRMIHHSVNKKSLQLVMKLAGQCLKIMYLGNFPERKNFPVNMKISSNCTKFLALGQSSLLSLYLEKENEKSS